jgi:hypothetical protein
MTVASWRGPVEWEERHDHLAELPETGLAYNDGFNARTLNRIRKLVEQHRDDLERAWHEYFA